MLHYGDKFALGSKKKITANIYKQANAELSVDGHVQSTFNGTFNAEEGHNTNLLFYQANAGRPSAEVSFPTFGLALVSPVF